MKMNQRFSPSQFSTAALFMPAYELKEKWWAFPDLIWGPAEYEYSAQLAWVP